MTQPVGFWISNLRSLDRISGFNHRQFPHWTVGISQTSAILKSFSSDHSLTLLFGEIWPNPSIEKQNVAETLLSQEKEPNGLYNLALITENRVIIRSDRYRVYPVYYWQSGGEFIVSNNLGVIVKAIRPDFDFFRIREKLLLGYSESATTIWKGINRTGFQEILEITAEGIQRKQTAYRLSVSTVPTENDLYDSISSILNQQLKEPETMISLSGGSDTRLTFSFLVKNRIHRPVFTHGQATANDIRLAGKIARKFGYPSIQKVFPPGWLQANGIDGFSAIQQFSPGSNDLSSSHFAESYRYQQSLNKILIDSTAAEFLSRVVFPAVNKWDTDDLITEKIISFLNPGTISFLSTAELDQIKTGIHSKLKTYRTVTDDSCTVSDLYYLLEKSFNQDTCTWQVHHLVTRMPWLDQDFIDMATLISSDLKQNAGIHNRWIRKNAQGLVWIPLDHAGELKILFPNVLLKKALLAPQRLMNKLTGQRKKRYILHYDEWIKTLMDEWWGMQGLKSFIGDLTGLSRRDDIPLSLWNRLMPILWAEKAIN